MIKQYIFEIGDDDLADALQDHQADEHEVGFDEEMEKNDDAGDFEYDEQEGEDAIPHDLDGWPLGIVIRF